MSSEYDKRVLARAVSSSVPMYEHAFFEEGTLGGGGSTIVYGTLKYKERVGVHSFMRFMAAIQHDVWEFTLEHSAITDTTCYGAFKEQVHYTFAQHDPALGDTPLKNLCAWLQKYHLLPAGELPVCQLTEDLRAVVQQREMMFCPPPVVLLNRLLIAKEMQIVKGKLSLAVFYDQDDMLRWYTLLPLPVHAMRVCTVLVNIMKDSTPKFPQDTPDDAAIVGVAFSKEEDYSDCILHYWFTFGVKPE
jgi:hypothetical protein